MTNCVYFLDWALVQLAQLSLLIAIVALVERLLGRRMPKLLFGLWFLVMVKAITPPLWSSRLGLFSWTLGGFMGPEMPGGFSEVGPSLPAARLLGMMISPSVAPWLVAAWMIGMIALAAIWFVKWRVLATAIEDADGLAGDRITSMVDQLCQRLGLRIAPRVIVSNKSLGPAVMGFRSPMLILPAKLLQNLSPAELESVVGHELLHIRRRDFAVSLLGMLVKVLLWFFPPAWWAVERTIAAAERCVDRDVVARLHARRLDYVSALLRVLEIKSELRSVAGVPGMRPADVTDDRIAGILQDGGARSPRDGLVAWSLVLVTALIILPGRPLDIFGPSCTPAGDCGLLNQSTTGNEGRQ